MRTYLLTTGIVFALLAVVHVWRALVEGGSPASDPWFVIVTVIAVALSFWAFRLYSRSARSSG